MGFIPNEIISRVLERSDIGEVVSSYIALKRAGQNFKALCPFHDEKTPSFVVNPQKQIFHCFGCGAGGNAISFVMQQERMEFPEAVRLLAEKAGITFEEQTQGNPQTTKTRQQLHKINTLAADYFHHNLLFDKSPSAKSAREYLTSRQITPDMVKKFHMGFALEKWDGLMAHLRKHDVSLNLMEKAGLIISKASGEGFYDRFRNRIMFSIFDARRRCVAFGGRSMEDNPSAKYINSPETMVYTKGHHLYGLHLAKEAIGQQDCAIVVEGYTDFIMPFQAGVHHIVASQGTALTTDQIRLLRRFTLNVVMLFDSDQAGEAATLRSLDLLIEQDMNVKVATLTPATGVEGTGSRQARKDDPDSFIRRYGVKEFTQCISRAEPFFEFKLNIVLKKYDKKTIEGRARIAAEMLPTINKFSNAIVKSEYIKRLAQGLLVSQDALLEELKKMGKGTPAKQIEKISSDHIRPIERHLLKLMLDERDFIPLTKAQVKMSDFKNEQVRSIVHRLFDLFEQGRETSPSVVMSGFDDEKMLQTISHLMASEDLVSGDKQKIHRDCLHRLKKNRLKSQRQDILHQMETARSSGDEYKLDELKQEFNQLIKG